MKREQEEEEKVPAWLVTFSDLMTLLLTFFVLLLSMSVIDNQRKLEALGSIKAAFGVVTSKDEPDAEVKESTLEHGVFTQEEAKDLISERVQEHTFSEKDIEFIIDRDVAIIRISDDVLFTRGSYSLTREGQRAVDRLLPLIVESLDPVKILGSTSTLYDEYHIVKTDDITLLWKLSLRRALNIYMYFKSRGIPMERILLEGVSTFHPSFHNTEDAQGLKRARRTDFIFGKRDISKVERLRAESMIKTQNQTTTIIHGFEFSLER